MSERRETSIDRDVAATAALALYSFVVALGFARVFSGWSFLTDLAILVVVGHGVSFGLRRLRVSGWIAIPFVSLLLIWLLLAQQYRSTLSWLMPGAATRDQVELEVGLVRDQFQTAVAPVLYGAGWATLAGFALIIAIVMADSFAFRAEARGEALVPGGVLFVFIAALGSPRLRIGVTAALIGAGVIAVVALRALHDRRRRVELAGARSPGSMVLPTALGTAAAVAVLAGLVGPRIPGAHAEPLYDTRGRGGGVTEVVSPLVDIRSRLTNRSAIELFRVNADAPAYWRATTLPEFDGRTFRLPTRALERIDGAFGSGGEGARVIRQQIQVLALGGQLVPAAAEPFQAEGRSAGAAIQLRLNRDTNTLLSPDDLESGDLFTVVSAAPDLTPDQLRAATSVGPPDAIFLELPDDLPSIVGELAAQVAGNATTSFDKVFALQEWFRNEFKYSLDVQSGHGDSAIESFLNERIGYCEQFSATFAVMARTLDVPTRVAVGFTQGTLNEQGWYSVLGKNAHAWPEVWFDGIGWVGFEPTPGRGAPGAEGYTGHAAQQDDRPVTPEGGSPDNTIIQPTTPSTVVAPSTTVNPGATPTTTPRPDRPGQFPDGGVGVPLGEDARPSRGSGTPWGWLIGLGLVAAAVASPAIARRWRARVARAHGTDRVLAAWRRACVAAGRAGVIATPSMTVREWAAATSAQLPVAARPMGWLAEVVDQVEFAPPGTVDLERGGQIGPTLGQDCELWSNQVERIATDTLTPMERVRHYFTDWR